MNSPDAINRDEMTPSKKPDSGRVYLAKRVLDEKHPAMAYLKEVLPKLIGERDTQPTWITIGSLLNDSRNVELSFPFTTEKVSVKIRTIFRLLYQILIKKGRVEEEPLEFNAALETTLSLLLDTTQELITSPDVKVKKQAIQERLNKGKDPYTLRALNTFANEELPIEVWEDFIRRKVRAPEERGEIIPQISTGTAMQYLLSAYIKKNDIRLEDTENQLPVECILIYLLLIDSNYADQSVSMEDDGKPIARNIRKLLAGMVQYPMGVTRYSTNISEALQRQLLENYARRVYEAVLDGIYAKGDPEKLPFSVEAASKRIRANIYALLHGPGVQISDLPSLTLEEEGRKWKLPKFGLNALERNIEGLRHSNRFDMRGAIALAIAFDTTS